jgi:hypothetical protein
LLSLSGSWLPGECAVTHVGRDFCVACASVLRFEDGRAAAVEPWATAMDPRATAVELWGTAEERCGPAG